MLWCIFKIWKAWLDESSESRVFQPWWKVSSDLSMGPIIPTWISLCESEINPIHSWAPSRFRTTRIACCHINLIDEHLEQTIKHLIACCPIGKEHADKSYRKMNLTGWMIQKKESEPTVNFLLEGQSPLFSMISSVLLKISLNGIMWSWSQQSTFYWKGSPHCFHWLAQSSWRFLWMA